MNPIETEDLEVLLPQVRQQCENLPNLVEFVSKRLEEAWQNISVHQEDCLLLDYVKK